MKQKTQEQEILDKLRWTIINFLAHTELQN